MPLQTNLLLLSTAGLCPILSAVPETNQDYAASSTAVTEVGT
jgi:hypothetical protein